MSTANNCIFDNTVKIHDVNLHTKRISNYCDLSFIFLWPTVPMSQFSGNNDLDCIVYNNGVFAGLLLSCYCLLSLNMELNRAEGNLNTKNNSRLLLPKWDRNDYVIILQYHHCIIVQGVWNQQHTEMLVNRLVEYLQGFPSSFLILLNCFNLHCRTSNNRNSARLFNT